MASKEDLEKRIENLEKEVQHLKAALQYQTKNKKRSIGCWLVVDWSWIKSKLYYLMLIKTRSVN